MPGPEGGGRVYLEVPTNDEEINPVPVIDLARLLHRGVDRVERTMTLGFFLSVVVVLTHQVAPLLTQPSIAMRNPCFSIN